MGVFLSYLRLLHPCQFSRNKYLSLCLGILKRKLFNVAFRKKRGPFAPLVLSPLAVLVPLLLRVPFSPQRGAEISEGLCRDGEEMPGL